MKTRVFIFAILSICFIQAVDYCVSNTVKDGRVAVNQQVLLRASADSLKKHWRPEVPVLCYHQIGPGINGENGNAGSLTVSANAFEQQMKMLYDSGYRTILPDQLYAYLTGKMVFSFKPVMITFDDGTEGQFARGLKTLDKYRFKATFFIMTVSINKPGYLSKAELQSIINQGHVIGNHTWDHHNVKEYSNTDWKKQLDDPAKTLEAITGKPVVYFAYPYGSWTQQAIQELKKRNYKLAFILHTPSGNSQPLFTVRRLMANSSWTPKIMMANLHKTFPGKGK
jgi:peptidoglycan/xylan/chitin deacetylase (PgdA/CDA1 family)